MYAPLSDNTPCYETSPISASNCYGRTKVICDMTNRFQHSTVELVADPTFDSLRRLQNCVPIKIIIGPSVSALMSGFELTLECLDWLNQVCSFSLSASELLHLTARSHSAAVARSPIVPQAKCPLIAPGNAACAPRPRDRRPQAKAHAYGMGQAADKCRAGDAHGPP